jgi:hypothetical protein
MAAAAGWYPDPEGRAEQRYWDGERWTEHVQRDGEPAVDVIEPKASWQRALEALGPEVRERPVPDLLGALAAGGGTLVGAGALVLGAGDDADNRPGILIASALLVLVGYLVAATGDRRLRPAAVAVAALGIVVFVFEAFRDTVADGKLAAPFIVLALLTLVMYVAPILRGRPFLLGVTLTSLVGCLTFLVAGDLSGSDNVSDASNIGASAAEDAYAALLVAGVVLLVAAFLLDHAGYHGVATVFVAVAVISVVAGAAGTASRFGEAGGAILVALAGLALAIVGALGQRRFTTWFGAAVVTYGVAALVLAIVSSDDRVGGGILLAVFGAALVAVSFVLPRIWRARAGQTGLPPPTAS